MSKKDKRG